MSTSEKQLGHCASTDTSISNLIFAYPSQRLSTRKIVLGKPEQFQKIPKKKKNKKGNLQLVKPVCLRVSERFLDSKWQCNTLLFLTPNHVK